MRVLEIETSILIDGIYLTAIGMVTALLLLLFLIFSVFFTKIIGIKLGLIHIPPTAEELRESNLRATAAAAALASLYPNSSVEKEYPQ